MRAVHDQSGQSGAFTGQLAECLRKRKIPSRFLYESPEQTARWLALRRSCTPLQTDPDCRSVYEAAFARVSQELQGRQVHVVGLGCGDGSKEVLFLRALSAAGCSPCFTAMDIGPGMIEAALTQAGTIVPRDRCGGVVLDVSCAQDLAPSLADIEARYGSQMKPIPLSRACTFFGMLPVLQPDEALSVLNQAVRPGDTLLVSANLAPGEDYQAGMERVLPQYDNIPTREWLLGFLAVARIDRSAGELQFNIEDEGEIKRITARFTFNEPAQVRIGSEEIPFPQGSSLRLFQSFRHTPRILKAVLQQAGFNVREQWATNSGEEGVFLVERLQ